MKLDLPTVIFALLFAKGSANQVPLTTDSQEDIDELERKWGYNVNFPPSYADYTYRLTSYHTVGILGHLHLRPCPPHKMSNAAFFHF